MLNNILVFGQPLSEILTAWAAVNIGFLIYARCFHIFEYVHFGQEDAEKRWRKDYHWIWSVLGFVVLPLVLLHEALLNSVFEAGHYEFMVKENAEETKQILEDAGEL